MAVRNIVKIDEDRCNGCGLCAKACAEGAIKIVDGKAKLVSEIYCDGLGACIGQCPEGAIAIETREAALFDEEATKAHLLEERDRQQPAFVCPGMMARDFGERDSQQGASVVHASSQLRHWPVQLKLVPVSAPYFAGADLLLVADCVPFAMGDFHNRFLKSRSIAVGCPKLDDGQLYIEKVAQILKTNRLRSLTVVHMEVPCCRGLTRIAREAVERSGIEMGFEDVTIGLNGNILTTGTVGPKGRSETAGDE